MKGTSINQVPRNSRFTFTNNKQQHSVSPKLIGVDYMDQTFYCARFSANDSELSKQIKIDNKLKNFISSCPESYNWIHTSDTTTDNSPSTKP
ncbi:hypothetical protein Sjap_005571 [Stephania japonica]|uniref:Uncharacterized protein n=1 Tax=Stephania japonica TaxID=461633 RepID=A0AAP0K5V1_9MAGN